MKHKIIKSLIAFMLCIMLFNICAFAESITFQNTLSSIEISLHINKTPSFLIDDVALGLYDSNDNIIDTQRYKITKTGNDLKLVFNFSDSILGENAYLKLLSGASGLAYNERNYNVGDKVLLSSIITGNNNYSINVVPKKDTGYPVSVNGNSIEFSDIPRVIKNTAMIPLEEYLKVLKAENNAKIDTAQGTVAVSYKGHNVCFKLNSSTVVCDNVNVTATCEAMLIDGMYYVPLRTLVEGLGGVVTPNIVNGVFSVGTEFHEDSENEKFVKNIKSKTDYLIWVSKKTYKTTVFKKSGDSWLQIKQFDCALGANSTPTITGEFEYFAKETAWKYEKYYVGPIMRFYKGGYALHSTLLNYDGTEYDGRTGVNISHGCVRLHPEGINWLAENIPLNTKVYITKN